jgi:hypothetical protein
VSSRRPKTTRVQAMQDAVTAIHRAQRELAFARRRLAKATCPDAPPVIAAPQYRALHAAVHARNPQLHQIPGVVACVLGRVRRGGIPTGELCMTVLVERKLSAAELRREGVRALPKAITVGKRRVHVDVVEVGRYLPHVLAGTSLGPAATASGVTDEGTLGVFATDLATNAKVAITAMHVMRIREFPDGNAAPQVLIPSLMRNEPTTTLGTLLFGTRSGIDAAKISIDDPGNAASIIPGIGAVAGWRPVTFPGDENAPVRLCGAVSGVTHGAIIHVGVPIPEAGIDNAILADIPSRAGDSGAPLVDAQNHILGFLAGQLTGGTYANLRVFSPVATVLSVLQCDIEGES